LTDSFLEAEGREGYNPEILSGKLDYPREGGDTDVRQGHSTQQEEKSPQASSKGETDKVVSLSQEGGTVTGQISSEQLPEEDLYWLFDEQEMPQVTIQGERDKVISRIPEDWTRTDPICTQVLPEDDLHLLFVEECRQITDEVCQGMSDLLIEGRSALCFSLDDSLASENEQEFPQANTQGESDKEISQMADQIGSQESSDDDLISYHLRVLQEISLIVEGPTMTGKSHFEEFVEGLQLSFGEDAGRTAQQVCEVKEDLLGESCSVQGNIIPECYPKG
jgi:hypothetical protein